MTTQEQTNNKVVKIYKDKKFPELFTKWRNAFTIFDVVT